MPEPDTAACPRCGGFDHELCSSDGRAVRVPTTTTTAALPPCPKCGAALRIESRMTAKPVGSFSLAGAQTKFSATEVPWIVCDSCGLESEGKRA